MLIEKNSVILFFGMLLGVLLSIGSSVFAERESAKTSTSTATNRQQKTVSLPYEELRRFTEVFGRIKRDYVEQVTDKKLLEDAIKGMLSGLDPHSAYLDAEQYKGLKEGTTGQFGGLGIEVTMENGFVKVISPIDDTPAKRAGIQAGDLIVRLDKKPVKGMSLADAVKLMRGKPGDDILLTVIREGADAPLKVTITRAIIKVKSVKNKILEKDFGYIRISSFQSRTGQGLVEAVNALKKENQNDLKGLVLDLRNNPGGVLNAAVAVSDAFLEKGLIVYTEGRIKNSEMRFNAAPGDIVDGVPIVVLINAGSASASEIVAGALQDHHRAILMGEKSFGKGSVQTILPTGNDAAVKLTTARYYTPSGRSIQAEGIEPDIVLARVKLEALATSSFKPVKEADLSHHLENGDSNKEGGEDKNDEDKNDEDKAEDSDLRDYPLHQALTLLKGLSILNK
ncbi:MAG: S41 family peptidase [Methylococcales symbiont of Hymedesmia sp. n. MRB-2018]|nr:MAG: S41 family peptidase [Methylococcales symbiont of Hymedesmia sp. n. MRB-2018]KAF3984356.1 MAG: S41 family peptidase [Methylococcales symbiont of Hymedesmia sp. n. MRB-2018]